MERNLTDDAYAPLKLEDSENEIEETSNTPIGDYLDKICPYYLALGVSYDEFWNGDFTKLKYIEKAHQLNIEKRNQELWMQGLYFYEALSVVMSNAFSKKGSKPKEYPKEPHRITPLTEEEKEAEKKKKVEEFRNQLMILDRRFSGKHTTHGEVNSSGS